MTVLPTVTTRTKIPSLSADDPGFTRRARKDNQSVGTIAVLGKGQKCMAEWGDPS
jgi:hypothetical protein